MNCTEKWRGKIRLGLSYLFYFGGVRFYGTILRMQNANVGEMEKQNSGKSGLFILL